MSGHISKSQRCKTEGYQSEQYSTDTPIGYDLYNFTQEPTDRKQKERDQYNNLMQEWKSQIDEKKGRKKEYIAKKATQIYHPYVSKTTEYSQRTPFKPYQPRAYNNQNNNSEKNFIINDTKKTNYKIGGSRKSESICNKLGIEDLDKSIDISVSSKSFRKKNLLTPRQQKRLKKYTSNLSGSISKIPTIHEEIPFSEILQRNKSMLESRGFNQKKYVMHKPQMPGELKQIVDWENESNFHVTAKKVSLNNIISNSMHNDFLKNQMQGNHWNHEKKMIENQRMEQIKINQIPNDNDSRFMNYHSANNEY